MSSKFHVPRDGLIHLIDFNFIKYSNKINVRDINIEKDILDSVF